ncbi:hypothetical protein [uncultured Nisaea sp.]|uniref:hypothetical protein n=1 Tax=uncultured Nisaea sp. TaxID=538215 RepID=UPI0030EBB79F|tara:strand:+ start:387 stop:1268 length:882 start_codon:yes stop_codon:yes gene_type:complete
MAAELLPQQPMAPDARQRSLSKTHIDVPAFMDYLGRLRREVDAMLAPQFPDFSGKPYPLGRCREIRDAVYDRLVADIHQPRCATSLALLSFIRGGGIGRKIWGVLRESYFQNAMQFGTFYVDVANDTVNPAKPSIEILPLTRSGMVSVSDFFHFARIAESYWKCDSYANTAFPGVAAFFPIICVNRTGGGISLAPGSDQMIALTRSRNFQPALDFLKAAPSPPQPVLHELAKRQKVCTEQFLKSDGDAIAEVERAISSAAYESDTYYASCVSAYREFASLSEIKAAPRSENNI